MKTCYGMEVEILKTSSKPNNTVVMLTLITGINLKSGYNDFDWLIYNYYFKP